MLRSATTASVCVRNWQRSSNREQEALSAHRQAEKNSVHSIALVNVCERLEFLYGHPVHLKVQSELGKGRPFSSICRWCRKEEAPHEILPPQLGRFNTGPRALSVPRVFSAAGRAGKSAAGSAHCLGLG